MAPHGAFESFSEDFKSSLFPVLEVPFSSDINPRLRITSYQHTLEQSQCHSLDTAFAKPSPTRSTTSLFWLATITVTIASARVVLPTLSWLLSRRTSSQSAVPSRPTLAVRALQATLSTVSSAPSAALPSPTTPMLLLRSLRSRQVLSTLRSRRT